MAVLTQEIDTIREDASSVSYQKRDFEKEIKSWLEDPCDDNLDRINHIRNRLVQSSRDIEDITERIGALTWKISNPNEEVLRALDHMIALSRYLYQGSASLISTYKPLWVRDVIKREIDDFKEVTEHLQEVTDDVEMAYFVLPGVPGFDDVTRELESL